MANTWRCSTNNSSMKLVEGVATFFLFGLLASCSPGASNLSPRPESNFGFIFENGPCNVDKLNTFAGEFTQDRVVDPPITIPLALTDGQMKIIYEKMVEIKMDQYPEEFKISKPLFGDYAEIAPAYYYSIQIENGKLKTSTRWVDNIVQPTSEKADRLRELFNMIIGMVETHPNYIQLPEVNFGCV